MKKKITKLTVILLTLAIAFAVSACGCGDKKQGAQIAQSVYSFDASSENGLSVSVNFGDSAFEKLTVGETEVASENYTLSNGTLTLNREYLLGLGEGTHTFTVVTDLGNVAFDVSVSSTSSSKLSIDDLMSDDFFRVELGTGNGLVKFPENPDADNDINKYLRFKEGNKPLAVDESFTVNFGEDDYWSMRLCPYNDLIRPNSFRESSSAAFAYVEDEFGKGLRIWGDDYYGADSIKFKGSSFLNGATYKVEVSYRTGTVANAKYRMRFYNSILFEMSGSDKIYTKEATFTVPEDLYLTGDHTWFYDCLYLDVDCSAVADITVYSLKLTRTA